MIDKGRKVDNGQREPAVRILPVEGAPPREHGSTAPRSPRWFLPAGVLIGIAALFLLATTSPESPPTAVTTTQPPPIASVNAETIDLRTDEVPAVITDWDEIAFTRSAQVNDMIRRGGIYLAVGATSDGGAQAWYSGTGSSWSMATSIDRPDDGKSSIDRVAHTSTDFVGLGRVNDTIGVWTARTTNRWVYVGPLDESVSGSVLALTAGDNLLAVVHTGMSYRAWTSTTGDVWTELDQLQGLENAVLSGVAATDDAYLAYGMDSGCAVIFRSTDGVNWQPTLDPSEGCGRVVDVVVVDGRMLALGWMPDSIGWNRIAIWESVDGVEWERLALREPLLAPTHVDLEIVSTQPGDKPTAVIEINRETVVVTEGTTLETDIGAFTVAAVLADSIDLSRGSTTVRIDAGRSLRFRNTLEPRRIVAENERIVVIGDMSVNGWPESSPVVWASPDDGQSWALDVLPGESATSYQLGTRAAAIAALGTGASSVTGWRAQWDSTSAAEIAIGLGETYLMAVAQHDPQELIKTVPAAVSTAHTGDYAVPSLGNSDPGWFDEAGNLVTSRVEDTMLYLAGLNTSITIEECSARVTFGASDRSNVECDFIVNSDLMRLYGIEDGEGTLSGVVRDGALVEVKLDPSPSAGMWAALGNRLSRAGGDPPAESRLVFNEATAAGHLEAMGAYLESVLRPGQTRQVDTALGTIEWSWVEPLDFDLISDSILWTRFGFTTVAFADDGSWSLLTSEDGRGWEYRSIPADIEGLWDLQPFGEGLLGSTWRVAQPGLAFFDGEQWTPIELPTLLGDNDYIYTVPSEDSALVFVWHWDSFGNLETFDTVLVDTDLSVRVVDNPPYLIDGREQLLFGGFEVTASPNGFLATIRDFETGDISVWGSRSGEDWTLLTEHLALEDTVDIWNLQQHGNRYFVVGTSAETVCVEGEFTEECYNTSRMWTSEDGATWHELHTTDGDVVAAAQIGSGQLGLAAFGYATNPVPQPRSLYVSTDGVIWEEVPDLALSSEGSMVWFSPSRPAISDDTIIMLGRSYVERQTGIFDDTSFMIVGRLIDE